MGTVSSTRLSTGRNRPVTAGPDSLLAEMVSSLVSIESAIAGLQALREYTLALSSRLAQVMADDDARLGQRGGAEGRVWGLNTLELAQRTVAAELATATRTSDRSMQRQLDAAVELLDDFPATFQALAEGRISTSHVRVIRENGAVIVDRAARSGYEHAVLAVAEVQTPGRVRRIAAREAGKAQPMPLAERYQLAREERRVWVNPLPDGMAELGAVLPAAVAHGVLNRLTCMARRYTEGKETAGAGTGMASDIRTASGRATAHGAPPSAGPAGVDASASASAAGGNTGSTVLGRGTASAVLGHSAGESRANGHSIVTRPAIPPNTAPLDGDTGTSLSGIDAATVALDSQSEPRIQDRPRTRDQLGRRDQFRTRDQLRADLLADLLLRGVPSGHDEPEDLLSGIAARVEITVPVLTLMGNEASGQVSAELNGRLPIDPFTARALAGQETAWNRVLTDPITGVVLSVDRYRPSAELRRVLRARDSRCRFPGCNLPAAELDLDHTHDAAQGGTTELGNLAGLCRRHHTLKHHGRWSVRQTETPRNSESGASARGGVLEWTSPTGRRHTDHPPTPATTVSATTIATPQQHTQCADPPGRLLAPDPPPF
ncbi:DUF222 domain-containing protein [Arthrobacter sp. NPDC090010]|uniref:HNH endonuclease signature motif containing protein n=1 Tax=Arthrobacter sp. NPDC090010 TaxID=3363942 RepID=UPI00382FCB09